MKTDVILSRTVQQGDCLIWQGSSSRGYGQIRDRGKKRYVHRLIMEEHLGKRLQSDEHVCHRCDTPLCCNVNHLFVGTALDNVKDKVAKNRQHRLKGESNGRSKLTEVQVVEILKDKTSTRASLARKYQVTPTTIGDIRNRKLWKHLDIKEFE